VKSAEQQGALMLASLRDQMTKRRTQLSNIIRGHAAEFGLVGPRGHTHIAPLLARIAAARTIPVIARELFAMLGEEYAEVTRKERALERRVIAWHRRNELSRRLAEIPSVGPIGAATAVMKVPDPHAFRRGRDFAAWIGLTPKDHSTAGKQRLGVITRAGDEELRRLLVNGAMSVVKQAQKHPERASRWLVELLNRKPPKLVAVALANKTARIMWKLMVSGERYRGKPQPNPSERSSPRSRSVAPCSRRQGRSAPPSAVACGQP
jgi:transposase